MLGEEVFVLDLHIVGVEAEEILVEIEAKTHVLVSVNVHVIMVRVVLLSVESHTLHQ